MKIRVRRKEAKNLHVRLDEQEGERKQWQGSGTNIRMSRAQEESQDHDAQSPPSNEKRGLVYFEHFLGPADSACSVFGAPIREHPCDIRCNKVGPMYCRFT